MAITDPLTSGPPEVPAEDAEQPDTPTAWLIRAGKGGENYEYNIKHGRAGLGWTSVPDLRSLSGRHDVEEALRTGYPNEEDGTISSWARQMWSLLRVRVNDLVVMPNKRKPEISLGTVTREYWFDNDDVKPPWRHVVEVAWEPTRVPRSAVNQDLKDSLDAPPSIYSIKRKDGAWRLQQLLETGRDPGPRAGSGREEPDLAGLVERFRDETGFPTAAHKEQERLRAEWAKKLAEANVASLSREDLNSYANIHAVGTGKYVRPLGRVTQRWIRELDESQYSRLLESIRDLCWGEGDLAARIDRLVDKTGSYRRDAGTKGFAGANVSATLAICRPERFLPVPTQGGKWGRIPMLRELGLPEPPDSTYGQRAVDANDRLRAHLSPYFGDDPLAIGTFLGWLMELVNASSEQPPSGDHRLGEGAPELDAVADELLVDVEFLDDIVELLKDKGQVILYGPPGTGKTYLARELAKVLAPDDSCRALVQFHPSTSYEDFFEGYRPAKSEDGGGIRYELTLGPLARMAKQAFKARDRQHVMIIDEINRGNLPRVLGELLFLLEYRDERVNTLYRPEETFELPKNLWFIGTMNTADRSIALVDAALRRRFHFVPFFPNRWPIADLLADWLEREDQPDWLGRLVEAVNDELERELGGPHLLLGPSHFMKEYGSSLDEQRQQLRRIWEYNIEPFIEDQFFGNRDQIELFRFESVWNRHGPSDEREDGTGGYLRDTEQGLASEGSGGNRELWTSRASDFPPQDHPGDESYHAEIGQVVRRYVEFALSKGADPGRRDGQLVEEFLSSREPEYADKTKTDYRLHVRKWFAHVDVTWGT